MELKLGVIVVVALQNTLRVHAPINHEVCMQDNMDTTSGNTFISMVFCFLILLN